MTTKTHRRDSTDAIEILLVEDNPGDIRLTKEAFKTANTEISLRAVTHGDDAVDSLKRQATDEPRSLPDIVLLDLNLPGTNGHEVLKTIRADSQLKQLPVIILSSSETPDDIKRSYDADANAYVTKPDSPDQFSSIVTAVEDFWFKRAHLPPIPQ